MLIKLKMFNFAIFSFMLVLFVGSGAFKIPEESPKEPKSAPVAILTQTQVHPEETVPKPSITSDGTQANSSPTGAKSSDSKKASENGSATSTPQSPASNKLKTMSANEAPNMTNDVNNTEKSTTAAQIETTAKTVAEAKASDGTMNKTVAPAKPTNGHGSTAVDDKKAKDSATDAASKAGTDQAKNPPSGLKTPGTSIKKDKENEPDPDEDSVLPPPPNRDDTHDVGDASNPNPPPRKDNGLEEPDDGIDGLESENKSMKEKAGQVKGNRKEVAPKDVVPKMHFDSGSGDEPENSHFLAYISTIGILCIAAYLVAHNRHKIMGLILEGRSGRRGHRSGSTSRGVKYKRLQPEEADGESGVSLSSRDGGRVIY